MAQLTQLISRKQKLAMYVRWNGHLFNFEHYLILSCANNVNSQRLISRKLMLRTFSKGLFFAWMKSLFTPPPYNCHQRRSFYGTAVHGKKTCRYFIGCCYILESTDLKNQSFQKLFQFSQTKSSQSSFRCVWLGHFFKRSLLWRL